MQHSETTRAKLTQAGLNLIQQALSIYDSELRLVVCNRRFGLVTSARLTLERTLLELLFLSALQWLLLELFVLLALQWLLLELFFLLALQGFLLQLLFLLSLDGAFL